MPASPPPRPGSAALRAAAAWLGAGSAGPAWAAAGETGTGVWILVSLGAALIGALAGVATAVALQAGRPRREQARLRRALASCCDWWWSTDDAMRVTQAEAAGRAAPAHDLRALHGRPPWQPDPKLRAAAPAALSEAIGRQLPFQGVELPMPSEQQPQRVLRLSGTPLFSPAGRFAGYAGVASLLPDGTLGSEAGTSMLARIHQLEAESAGRAQRHEQAVRELDGFAHSVSHDLRAPLRVIDGFAQIVLEDYGEKIDALGREHLKRIVAAGARMNSMIDTLLSMSRMTAHDLRCERVDLSQAARQLADELARQEPARQVEVAVAPGLAADGDPTLLRLVLQNLLGNAFKFSSRTPAARVEFGRQADADHAYFVRDNGAGFDMRFADRLFGVFQRLHSQSEFAGTGVGLATVQRIVRRHGGRIWAESEPGQGATFYFTLWEHGAPPG